MWTDMLFSGWSPLIRVIVVGTLAYVGMVLVQRVTGKRTLSKMNAFDLIVTVALGSALANALLSKTVALVEGLLAFALLMGLQLLVTWLSVRSHAISRIVKSEPRMLAYHGQLLHEAMHKERVVEAEVLQALRSAGVASLDEVEAVVLETDGTFSIVQKRTEGRASTLRDVHGPDQS